MYPNIGSEDELLQSYPPNSYAENATQQFPLGTKLIQGERVWRYCKNSSAALTTLGTPLQSAARIHAEADDDIVLGVTASIGDYDISLTSTTNLATSPLSTANGFAEGYLYVNDSTGQGQTYKIKSHEAASGTNQFIVTLYDPLTVAVTAAASEFGIVQNSYANVIATAAVLTSMCVGVNPIAVTASYYFWSQTGGPAAIACNAAVALGTSVVVGTTAAKADPGAAATTEVLIGYPLTPGVTTDDHFLVFLTLDR